MMERSLNQNFKDQSWLFFQLPNKDLSMLEERIKRTGKYEEPALNLTRNSNLSETFVVPELPKKNEAKGIKKAATNKQ